MLAAGASPQSGTLQLLSRDSLYTHVIQEALPLILNIAANASVPIVNSTISVHVFGNVTYTFSGIQVQSAELNLEVSRSIRKLLVKQ